MPARKKLDTNPDAPPFSGIYNHDVALLDLEHIAPEKWQVIVEISDGIVRVKKIDLDGAGAGTYLGSLDIRPA